MVRDCGTPSPTVNEVRSHYGYAPEVPVEEEPVGPEVPGETTADIPPPTTEEPEVPVVTVPTEKLVCSEVWIRLDNVSVVKTSNTTLSVPQIQNIMIAGVLAGT